jgi:hypothetical protein
MIFVRQIFEKLREYQSAFQLYNTLKFLSDTNVRAEQIMLIAHRPTITLMVTS